MMPLADALTQSGIKKEFSEKFQGCWTPEAEKPLLQFLSQKGVKVSASELKAFLGVSEEKKQASPQVPVGAKQESSVEPGAKSNDKISQNMTETEEEAWQEMENQAPEEEVEAKLEDPISALAMEAEASLDELDLDESKNKNWEESSVSEKKDKIILPDPRFPLATPPDENLYGTDAEFAMEEGDEDDRELPAQMATMSEVMICEQLGVLPPDEKKGEYETAAMEVNTEEFLPASCLDDAARVDAEKQFETLAAAPHEEIQAQAEDAPALGEDAQTKTSSKKKMGLTERFQLLHKKIEKASKLYTQAKKLAKIKKYQPALDKFQQCLRLFPNIMGGEEYRKELESLLERHNRQRWENFHASAQKYYEEKHFPEAISIWSKALTIRKDPEVEKKISMAEEQLQEAMQLWENAQVLVDADRAEEAVTLLQQCLVLYPYHGSALEFLDTLKSRQDASHLKSPAPAKVMEDFWESSASLALEEEEEEKKALDLPPAAIEPTVVRGPHEAPKKSLAEAQEPKNEEETDTPKKIDLAEVSSEAAASPAQAEPSVSEQQPSSVVPPIAASQADGSPIAASQDTVPQASVSQGTDSQALASQAPASPVSRSAPNVKKAFLQNPDEEIVPTLSQMAQTMRSHLRRQKAQTSAQKMVSPEERNQTLRRPTPPTTPTTPSVSDEVEQTKEKAARQKQQLEKYHAKIQDCLQSQNYRQALQFLQLIAERRWICEVPDVTGKIREVKKYIHLQNNSKQATQKLQEIQEFLKFYDVETAESMLYEKIFTEEVEEDVKKSWQSYVNLCLQVANKRSWLRKVTATILILLLILQQMLAS